MNGHLPEVITLKAESSAHFGYDNHPIAKINDHVVGISAMTEPYHWHFHPNSDETFLVIEGRLSIEFESGSLETQSWPIAYYPSRSPPSDPAGWRAISEPHVRVGAVRNRWSLTPG